MAIQKLRDTRIPRIRWSDQVNLLAALVAALGAAFILRGVWVALFVLPLIAALALDGILRSHPAGRFRGATATAQQLVAPVALAVAAPLFFRYVSSGYWGLVAAAASGLLFAAVAYAAYFSVDASAKGGVSRPVLLTASYASLFGFMAAFYAFDLSLPAAAAIAGLAATICSFEVFREADLSPADLVVYTLATGITFAQVRWALSYLRIDGILAAMLLLLIFYVATGLTVSAVTRRLSRRICTEFAFVGLIGIVIVLAGRLITAS